MTLTPEGLKFLSYIYSCLQVLENQGKISSVTLRQMFIHCNSAPRGYAWFNSHCNIFPWGLPFFLIISYSPSPCHRTHQLFQGVLQERMVSEGIESCLQYDIMTSISATFRQQIIISPPPPCLFSAISLHMGS